jgi:hypothetical protein
VKLYCDACDATHDFTPGDVERIVYALEGMERDARLTHAQDRSGAGQCEPHGILSGDYAGHLEAEPTCLEEALGLASDSEGYAEHVNGGVEARRLIRREVVVSRS